MTNVHGGYRKDDMKEQELPICVFCGCAIGAGSVHEHVLPLWFLKAYFSSRKGTYHAKISVGGEGEERLLAQDTTAKETRKASGKMYRFAEVKLPVCGTRENNCNGKLGEHFENPAEQPMKNLIKEGAAITDPAQTEAVVKWVVKTLLLLRHPQAWHPELEELGHEWAPANRWTVPDEALLALRDKGTIPSGLSLWAAVVDSTTPAIELARPWVSTAVKAAHSFVEFSIGLRKGAGSRRSVLFHLRYRPGTTRDPFSASGNPFEDMGTVARLWPAPPAQLSVGNLPAMSRETVDEYVHRFPSSVPMTNDAKHLVEKRRAGV